MKGGVGKTTISCHFAAMAGRNELGHNKVKRTLLIDYDPQFNASQTMISVADYDKLEKEKKTVLSILMENPSKIDPFAIYSHDFNKPPKITDLAFATGPSAGSVDIIVSTLDLMYVALGSGPIKRLALGAFD
jgi:chromosome partitioning protein